MLRLATGLCLRAPRCDELPQKFPAARFGRGAPAAAAGDRGCAERQGPRHRHPLHRREVGRVPAPRCRLPARRLGPPLARAEWRDGGETATSGAAARRSACPGSPQRGLCWGEDSIVRASSLLRALLSSPHGVLSSIRLLACRFSRGPGRASFLTQGLAFRFLSFQPLSEDHRCAWSSP